MSLVEYRRKRQFAKTREPAPGADTDDASRAIFVVQLHHASHRHYDFRLQVGDALKSWAVPKGPSLDPAVKRLAVEVEDHPLGYARFEGDIPKGQYGGGHVAIFDHGFWSTPGDAEAQLAKGHLQFELFGDKLKGGWHLVRSKRPERKPQWLLIKQADRYAGSGEADDLLQDVTRPPRVDVAGGRRKTLPGRQSTRTTSAATTAAEHIVATKKPARRSRVDWARQAAALPHAKAAKLGNAAFAAELAQPRDTPPAGPDWLHETKWDGYRILATVVAGRARLWSRNALEWTGQLPEIAAALESLDVGDAAFDGELIAGNGSPEDFGLLQATLSGEKHAPLNYVLFDLLHLHGQDLRGAALIERKTLLEAILADAPAHLAYSSHIRGDGEEVFAMAIEHGLEGTVSKRVDSPYRAGRGDDWRKTKHRDSDEFAVVGFTAPKGRRNGFGALLLARPDSQHGWSYAGRVGSGFSDAQLHELGALLGQETRTEPTAHLEVSDPELRRANWVAPTLVVEVFHRGIGNQGLLRQPSFKAVRTDKGIDELIAPVTASGAGQTVRAKAIGRAGDGAAPRRLTHPERLVYPEQGITKQQVADYYLAVMDWFLPEVSGRPLSVVRCPDGAAKACFFQKHRTAGLEGVGTVRLEEGGGRKANYLVVTDADDVMELVQFNALEFHPWGALAKAPDRADRLVFDLDPAPDVEWAAVKDAARKVRELLQQLGLQSFLRTSGGKGLHVVVPLDPACDWEQVKPFARAFAESLAQSEPRRFVAVATKGLRGGRIFVDYLRNGRGATSVASYSLRARDGAPVAVPLTWSELGRLRSSTAFDLHSVPRRVRRLKSDPWAGIATLKQGLDQVARKLERLMH